MPDQTRVWMLGTSGKQLTDGYAPQTELTGRCDMKRKYNVSDVVVILGAVMLCASASAAPPMDGMVVTQAVKVKYVRARAQTPAGAEELYGSLQAAAARVCRDAGTRPTTFGDSYSACVDAALARAVDELDIAAVSDLHLQGEKAQGKDGVATVAKR
jgi:UrcA family protein